jgi:hypothetical protein
MNLYGPVPIGLVARSSLLAVEKYLGGTMIV